MSMQFDTQATKKIFGSDPTMGLFVALYLILLAFFIILTSVSSQSKQRVTLALDSFNETFLQTSRIAGGDRYHSLQVAAANDPVLRELSSRLSSEFNIEGSFEYSNGYVYQVTLPLNYLFEAGSFRVRASAHSRVQNILSSLEDTSSRQTIDLMILFGTGGSGPSREMTRSQEIAIRRAGSFAQFAEGYEGLAFSSGFAAVPEAEVMLVFRRVAASHNYSARLNKGLLS